MVKFQVLDWTPSHDKTNKKEYRRNFTIKLFGRTEKTDDEKSKTVYVRVDGFTPHFFVKIPDSWEKFHVDLFIDEVKSRVNFKFKDKLEGYSIVNKKDYYGFKAGETFKFIRFEFMDIFTFKAYEKIFKSKIYVRSLNANFQSKNRMYKLYESDLDQMLRCMHIKDLKASGWIEINDEDLDDLDEDESSICEENYKTHWSKLKPLNNERINKFVIAAFDIECTSGDGSFPQAIRPCDKIIQIGTTFSYYGEDECFYKHIVTLKSCDPIEGADVESFSTEEEVLLAWVTMITKQDPDFLIGYNIFGFDEKYMYDRAKLLKCDELFMRLSRLNDHVAQMKEKKLSSDALGDNSLNYFDMIGRVQIDLMNIVRRGYSLNSYKLDYVVSYFISEKNKMIDIKDKSMQFNSEKAILEADIRKLETIIKGLKENINDRIKKELGISVKSKEDEYKKIYNDKIEKLVKKKKLDRDNNKNDDCMNNEKSIKINKKIKEYISLILNLSKNRKKNKDEITELENKSIKLMDRLNGSKIKKNKKEEVIDVKLQKVTDEDKKQMMIEITETINKNTEKELLKKNKELEKLKKTLVDLPKNKNKDEENLFNVEIRTASTKGLYVGNYISISYFDGIADYSYGEGAKLKVIGISGDTIYCYDKGKYITELIEIAAKKYQTKWSQAKDDVGPNDIFRMQKGTSADRRTIAIYCLQDCALCNRLVNKLQVITNNIGMSNVCSVPLSYLFLRGQGIKGVSLISKHTRKDGYLIPVLPKYQPKLDAKGNEIKGVGYKGAHVFEPKAGLYLNPISVLDYSSLYPKSIIAGNMSHETFVDDPKYDNLKDYYYYTRIIENSDGTIEKCRFARHKSGKLGLLPKVLSELLDAREVYKKLCKEATDPFLAKIYDCMQLAYKITANSLYGICGAPTSQIFKKQIAASTTQTGAEMLHFAEKTVLENFPGSEIIYGDTDSIFINFNIKDKDGNLDLTKEALKQSIEMAQKAAKLINAEVPAPHGIIYEKTFFPFCIISKKRYVGDLYETDINKSSLKSMGIVLKRRDNANIVKCIVGGVIDQMMYKKDIKAAVKFVKKELINVLNGKYTMDKFVITKTLKFKYAQPTKIAHKVLADRMTERDKGSAPQVNDRIPFVYKRVDVNGFEPDGLLQGDRAEHPEYMKKNKLKIDYLFYITNQIKVPTIQFLELLMKNPEKIFDRVVDKELNRRKNVKEIDNFFKKTKRDADVDGVKKVKDVNFFDMNLNKKFDTTFELDPLKKKKLSTRKSTKVSTFEFGSGKISSGKFVS
jgi:DNA polymerase elongation subunit (family B)